MTEKILKKALDIAVETLNTTWYMINGDNYIPFTKKDFIDAAEEAAENETRRKDGHK